MNLYEIPLALRAALDRLEVDPETGEIMNADELTATELEAADKIESTVFYLKELQAEADAVKAEADRLAARRRAYDRKIEWLRGLVLTATLAVNPDGQIKTPLLTVFTRRNKKVVVDDEALLPPEFLVTKTTPSRTAIKSAIDGGFDVPGAHMEESLSVSWR